MAASNIFYFTELSYPNIKKDIIDAGYSNLRDACVESKYTHREPVVDINKRNLLLKKANKGYFFDKNLYSGSSLKEMKYCRRCLYSSASATPMQFDETGLCMGCKVYETKANISDTQYKKLKHELVKLVNDRIEIKHKERL